MRIKIDGVEYFTVEEIKKELGINSVTLLRWERSKKIAKPKIHPISKYRIYSRVDINKIKRLITPKEDKHEKRT